MDEKAGKVVGKVPAKCDYDRIAAIAEGLMPRLPFPKGVFRFKSFEEADAWTEKHILRAALKKSQDRRKSTT